MNLLHVIPGFANASGPTQVAAQMLTQLARRGHRITLLYTSGRGKDDVLATTEGIEKRVFPCRTLKGWAYAPGLRRWLDEHAERFDAAHVHSLWCYTNRVVRICCSEKNIPVIVRPAGTLTPWAMGVSSAKKKLYYRLIEKKNIEAASLIQAMSESEAAAIRKYNLKTPVFVLPNGLVLPEGFRRPVDRTREQLGIPLDARVMLSLGRLHPVKNLELVGQVFAEALKQEPKAFLVVAGPDTDAYAQSIKRRYAEWGIMERVRFVGEITGDDKWDLYSASDLFVLASTSENFGNVVLEAMAAGLPVLVSQGAPWPGIEARNAGFWLPLKAEPFIEKAALLLKDRELAESMGRAGEDWVNDEFNWSGIAERLQAKYEEILKH